jgi:hypothetical protein
MSENTIDATEPEAGTAVQAEPQEPSDEQLRSDEARRYRLALRETESQNAALTARAEAAERQVVESHVRGKFADANDFWSQAELSELRGEDGTLDRGAVDARANEVLDAHPHWRAPDPNRPLAASAGSVGSSGKIGFGPGSVLDGDNVAAQTEGRSWGEFFSDSVRGKM